jgi:hypothetical protein
MIQYYFGIAAVLAVLAYFFRTKKEASREG